MGYYLNPGNSGFERITSSEYVDKTNLISILNRTINTADNLTCVSRPRRFGKSFAAQMICAYYGKGCDSRKLFEKLKIAGDPSFEKHLNRYDVIYIDLTGIKPYTDNYQNLVPFLKDALTKELKEQYPDIIVSDNLAATLANMADKTGTKMIIILDEWDAPVRENPAVSQEYIEFLRSLFKNSGATSKIFAAAYMTGILPIKKDGSQSAISDFKEYSMLDPLDFAEYFGFTEEEVRELCIKYNLNFVKAKYWYDGYTVGAAHSIYNPFSVISAIKAHKFKSYWKKTSAAETLMTYIDMDQNGLQEDIAALIAGENISVDTDSFQNDVKTFKCKDDVLTLLVHLGYLSYEEVYDSCETEDFEELDPAGSVHIPNEEVRAEFKKILRRTKHVKLVELVEKSDQLLQDTIAGNEEAVAKAIQEIHDSECAPTFYNNEQGLRYVVKMAYLSSVDQFAKLEELPSGHGIADIVFIPKKRTSLPAMIVELKWNKGAEGALRQIRDRNYHKVLQQFEGEILLVGINYSEVTKLHTCKIERIQKTCDDLPVE